MPEHVEAPRLVVFDLGGTTIRDRGEVPAAFAEALLASNLPVDRSDIAAWRGASKREVIHHLIRAARPALDDDGRERLAASVFRRFCATLTDRLQSTRDLEMPGIRTAIGRLRAAGVRVALNSGFDRGIIDTVFSVAGWPEDLFDAVVSGDDVPEGRPAPFMILRAMALTGVADGRHVAVVGDTRLDLEAAANAGAAWRIGVLSGAADRATLERAPRTHILDSPVEVPALLLGRP